MFKHTLVVLLRGDVGEADTGDLRRILVDAIMHRRPRRLVVDLGAVTALDPLAVGALIAAQDTAPQMRVRLALRRPTGGVAVQLSTAGLTYLID
jgi:anti-anti-sigma factor